MKKGVLLYTCYNGYGNTKYHTPTDEELVRIVNVTDEILFIPKVTNNRFTDKDGKDYSVLIDYSHTPDALEKILQTARDVTRCRLICLFGCGGDRDRSKRPIMGAIAQELADLAQKLADSGNRSAYRRIMDAVVSFDMGNATLAAVLDELSVDTEE